MFTKHRSFFSFLLICSLLLASLVTAAPADATDVTELIRNGDFSNGLTDWHIGQGLDESWDPMASGTGEVNLHPTTMSFFGPVLYQDMNITNIASRQVSLSFELWQDSTQEEGSTILGEIVYIDTSGNEQTETLTATVNNSVSKNQDSPDTITGNFIFPSSASKLVRFVFFKNYYGSFNADNVSLSMTDTGVTVGLIPSITSLSSQTSAYGDTITINGQNFGTLAPGSTVVIDNRPEGITITNWDSTSIEFTVNAPVPSGSVKVISAYVPSANTMHLDITSPHFTIISGHESGRFKVIQGQPINIAFGIQGHNGYTVPTDGITFSLVDSNGTTITPSPFASDTLYNEGGIMASIDTSGLPSGIHTVEVHANDGTSTLVISGTVHIITTQSLAWYDHADTTTPITTYTVTTQGQINGWDNNFNQVGPFFKAVDNEGNPLPWDAINIITSNNPSVLLIYQPIYGLELYSNNNGNANLSVTSPDGTTDTLAVTVNAPASPSIALDITPPSVTNNTATKINFGVTSTHFVNSWGHDGFLDFSFNSQGVPAPWDPATSNTQSMPESSNSNYTPLTGDSLGDNYLALEPVPETGEYLFYADTSDGTTSAKATALLTITNDSTYSAISGWIASLEPEDPNQPPLSEMFTLDFFDTSGSLQFTRQNYGHPSPDGTYHFDAIEPGDYLVRCTFEINYLGANRTVQQWYPNGTGVADAEPLVFTAGSTTSDINFFFRFPQVSAQQLITEGRAALFNTSSTTDLGRFTYSGMVAAKDKFKWALEQEPTNQEANFLFAFTSVLADIVYDYSPYTDDVIVTLRDLLTAFGATQDYSNDFYDAGSPFIFPTDPTTGDLVLPPESPTGDQISAFISDNMIPLIDNALASLAIISAPFDLTMLTTETGDFADTEVDYGDVLALKSMLQFVKFFVLLNTAYDLDNIDIDALVADMNNGTFNYNTFLTSHPNLLNLAFDGTTTMALAKTTLIDAIDSFIAASAYIRGESDDQIDDLVTIDPEMVREEQWFRDNLTELRDTLTVGNSNSGQPWVFDMGFEHWRFYNQDGFGVDTWLETDGSGNLISGEYYGPINITNNTFISDTGTVDSVLVVGSDITIQTSNDDPSCSSSATLTGTLSQDGTNISNGTFTANNCTNPSWSGTFTANKLEEQDESIRINFSTMLDTPISIRDQLPQFVHDPYNNEMIMKGLSSLPDQTFGGILPDGILERGIDKVQIWGGQKIKDDDSVGVFTKFSIWTYDLPLWEITSVQLFGPDGQEVLDPSTNAPLDFAPAYHYRSNSRLQASAATNLAQGWYDFVLTDRTGRQYREGKYFTPNLLGIPVPIGPANESYVNTTTPTFTWNGITDDLITTIYYRIDIQEWNTGVSVYTSDRFTGTSPISHTVPAGALEPDTPYRWKVQAFDSNTGVATNNFSNSKLRGFHTGPEAANTATATIDFAFIRSRVNSDTDTTNDQTQFGIKFTGPAPWDFVGVEELTVTNSIGHLEIDFLADPDSVQIRENGYFTGTGSIKSNDTYTFTVSDNRTNGTPIVTTRDFTFNRLPVPSSLFSVPWEGTVPTTTPTFAWEPVEDGTAPPLYYRVRIIDAANNTVYQSPLSTDSTFTMPSGYLLPNCGYGWKVEVYDNDGTTPERTPQNRADSTLRPFFVSPDAAPASTGSVTGTISAGASGYISGQAIYVSAFDRPYEGTGHIPLSSITLFDTGTFTLSNLPVGKPLYIYSRWDKDDSHTKTPGDWVGIYAGNPLILADTTLVSGIDITLTTEVFSEQQIINFDSVDAGWGPVDAASYLVQFGIGVTDLTPPGSTLLQIHRDFGANDGNGLIPSSLPNSLSQDGSNDPVSFTLVFDQPLDSFTFTRPMLNAETTSGITHPIWSGHALDATGNELETVGESMIASYSDVPARTFTLNGPGIASVRFDSDNQNWAAFSSVQLDDFILTRTAAIKGDANSDGNVDITDVIYIFQILTGQAPGPVDPGADVDGDGNIGMAEIVFILKSLAQP